MPEGTRYTLEVQLRTTGSLQQQMARSAQGMVQVQRASSSLGSTFSAAGAQMEATGAAIAGTALRTSFELSRAAAMAGAIGGAAGLGMAVRSGMSFHRLIENTKLQVGTMYQLFGLTGVRQTQVADEADRWKLNLEAAQGAMTDLSVIANKSPASLAQIAGMYQNASSGLTSATQSIKEHMQFAEKTVLLGGLTGGDYKLLGAQVGRIMAGSAGAEMNIWKVLQEPLLKAGKGMGVFNDRMQVGTKMTETFNNLAGDKRFALFMAAAGKVGPSVAKSFATSMDGLTSTTKSAMTKVAAAFTTPLFEGFRSWLERLNSEGGLLGDAGLKRILVAAKFFGERFASVSVSILEALAAGTDYLVRNWARITVKFGRVIDHAVRAAKLFGAVSLGRMAAGKTLGAAGAVVSVGGSAMQGMQGMASSLGGMGKAALIALPAIIGFGTILSGIGILGASLGAYMIDNWKEIKNAISDGTVTFRPVIMAVRQLWGMLNAAGAAIFGASDAAGVAQGMISMLGKGLEVVSRWLPRVLKAGSFLIKILEVFVMLPRMLFTQVKALWDFIAMMLENIPMVGDWADTIRDAAGGIHGMLDDVETGMGSLADTMDTAASAMLNAKPKILSAFEGAMLGMLRIAGSPMDRFVSSITGQAEAPGTAAITRIGQGIAAGKKFVGGAVLDLFAKASAKKQEQERRRLGGTSVNINRLVVNQDLRDHDPDRVMSAFLQPLEKLTRHRGQSFEVPDDGE